MSNMDTVDDLDLWYNALEYLEDQLDFKSQFQVLPDSGPTPVTQETSNIDTVDDLDLWYDMVEYLENQMDYESQFLVLNDPKPEPVHFPVPEPELELDQLAPVTLPVHDKCSTLKWEKVLKAVDGYSVDDVVKALAGEPLDDYVSEDTESLPEPKMVDLSLPIESEGIDTKDSALLTEIHEDIVHFVNTFDWESSESNSDDDLGAPQLDSQKLQEILPGTMDAETLLEQTPLTGNGPMTKSEVPKPKMASDTSADTKTESNDAASAPVGCKSPKVEPRHKPLVVQPNHKPTPSQKYSKQMHFSQPGANRTVPAQHCRQPVGNRTVPAQHCRQPVGNRTVPAQHCRQPVGNRTVPAQHCRQPVSNQTVPAQHCKQPVGNRTVPAQHCRQPVGNRTVPAQHCKQPVGNQTVTAQHCKQPVGNQTVPAQHCKQPVGNQTVPAQHCRQPVSNQTVPAQHCRQPVGNQTVPTQHCKQPVGNQTVPAQHCRQPVGNQTVPAQHCKQPERGHYQQYQQYQQPMPAQNYQHYSGPVHHQHYHGPVYYHQPMLMQQYGQPVYDQRAQYQQYGQPVYDQRAQYQQYGHGHPNQAQYVPHQFAVPQQPAPVPAGPMLTVAPQLVTPNQPTNNNSGQKQSNKRKRATAYVIEAPSAFSMFKDEQWFRAKTELNTTDNAQVNAALEQRWRSLSQEEQAKYHNQAQQAKRIFEQQFNPELCPVTAPTAESLLPKCNKRQRTIPSAASEFGLGREAWTKEKAMAILSQKDDLAFF